MRNTTTLMEHAVAVAAYTALALAACPVAFGAPVDLRVTVGGVSYLRSTPFTLWPGTSTAAGGGFTVSSLDPLGSIWLYSPPTFGLTDATFTCNNPSGCSGFQFAFVVLNESNPNLAHVNINMNGNAAGGAFTAQYFVTCSGPGPCLIGSPPGGPFPLSGGFSVGGVVDLTPPIGSGSANYTVTWDIEPSGGTTVPFGSVLSLPSSLEVQETPEPSVGVLVGLGLAALGAAGRKRHGVDRR